MQQRELQTHHSRQYKASKCRQIKTKAQACLWAGMNKPGIKKPRGGAGSNYCGSLGVMSSDDIILKVPRDFSHSSFT